MTGRSWSGRAPTLTRLLLRKRGRHVYTGYATDIITDLGIQFLSGRPKDRPFFLMLHHKAPHRNWQPDQKHAAEFAGRHIPEPATLRDNYDSRTDAIRECEQKVFTDLTRRDLKLDSTRQPGGKGTCRVAWREADRGRTGRARAKPTH